MSNNFPRVFVSPKQYTEKPQAQQATDNSDDCCAMVVEKRDEGLNGFRYCHHRPCGEIVGWNQRKGNQDVAGAIGEYRRALRRLDLCIVTAP